ncbi:UNVERIFIED_CONTAM: hypothetical protein Cloal_2468 [Acetivibrio alkalicellulosi]
MKKRVLFYPIKLIKYIKQAISEKKELRKIILEKQKYLVPGKYKIISSSGKKLIYVNDYSTKQFIQKNVMHLSKKRQNFIRKFIIYFISNMMAISNDNSCSSELQGTLVMVTRNKDIRIFDFKQKKNVVFLCNEDKLLTLAFNYELFSKYFMIPITQFDLEERKYTEEYLDFKPHNLWDENDKAKVIFDIFSNYKEYYQNIDKKKIVKIRTGKLYKEFKKVVKHHKLISLVSNIIINLDRDIYDWPLVNQHGDLGYHNILLNDGGCYFIDWEDSNKYIFFYDFFNYFYTSRNIKYYFEGFIDDELKELFSIFNIKYDSNNRLFYFIVFIMQRSLWEVKINPFPETILNRASLIIEDNIKYIEKKE